MSNANRKGIEFTTKQIGRALKAVENLFGNSNTPESNRLDFENNYIKLRGSTYFYDLDVSKKSDYTNKSIEFPTFDTSDIAEYTFQGGSIGVSYNITHFKLTDGFEPYLNSPPSPEGWAIYDYNAWSNYIPIYDANNDPNTNYVIYNPYGETGSGISRTNYNYPVRWSSSGSTYQRVPYFEYGMYVSVYNDQNYPLDGIQLGLPKDLFKGSLSIDPSTNAPKDLLVYSHRYLISDNLSSPITLSGFMGTSGISDTLDCLTHSVEECDIFLDNSKLERDYLKFTINIPNYYNWQVGQYLFFVFYWGSHDSIITTLNPGVSGITTQGIFPPILGNSGIITYPKKLFFNKKIGSSLTFNKTGINDKNIYFYNKNNIQNTFNENRFTSTDQPFRYKVSETIPGSTDGFNNSLSRFKGINKDEYIPFIIAVKNNGFKYDNPKLVLEIFAGDPINYENETADWENFDLYPALPKNYNPVCKIIASGSNKNDSIIIPDNINIISNDLSIVYLKQIAKNSLIESISDADFIEYFIDSFTSYSKTIRSYEQKKHLTDIGQRLISRFSGYDLNKIKNQGHFLNTSSNQYIALHNLLKLPTKISIGNSNEPKNIQIDNDAANLFTYFATFPPSINVAGFDTTSLYLKDINLKSDTKFEVYLESNNTASINGLSKDYTFRIKFNNTLQQKTIKDVFLTASSNYLTDSEYDKRKSKNLYTDGYYKKSSLNTIEDFSIYTYSAVIPDLKFGTYQGIVNKQNNPLRSDKVTESDYETSLRSRNPNINKNQIISSKSGFGLTDSFYIVDTSSPSDDYNSIEEISLSITNYRYKSNPYWINNSEFMYGTGKTSSIKNAIHIKDLRSDGFIIAPVGYYDDDNSINILENVGDQQIVSTYSTSINQLNQNGGQLFATNKIAFKVFCDETQDIKSINLKLRSFSDYINSNSLISADLYSDESDVPKNLLAKSSTVYLKNITNQFKNFSFNIDYRLFENKTYWIVVNISQLPPKYDPNISGLVTINDTQVTGVYNQSNNTSTNFSRYLVGAEIGIGNTNPLLINNWYEISSIASSTSMTVAATGTTLQKQKYSIRYKFEIGVEENNLSGADKNIYYYSGSGWSNVEGTPYVKFGRPDEDVLAAFNKDYTNNTNIIAPPNTYRTTSNLLVDEYWSFNNKNLFTPTQLSIYPRSVSITKQEIIGSGTAGSYIIKVKPIDYNEKIISGLAISQTNSFSSGTQITNIIYDKTNKLYQLFIDKPILNTFTSNKVGIGSNYNTYIKRANDIYVSIDYNYSGGTATSNYLLEKSPTWITYWFTKNRFTYNQLQKDLVSDQITSTYNLNFANYDIKGNYDYYNGYSIANFKPQAGLGTSFDFKFICSDGLRVYCDDNFNASLDLWKTNAAIGYSFSYNIQNLSDNIKFEVQFNKTKKSSGLGITLGGYWKIAGTGTWYPLDDSFYIDSSISPMLISSNDIKSIYLVKVNRTLSGLDENLPSTDRLVIRSI
jgi:hypothetical protein